MTHIAILGRQPELSIAELESVYGADALTPLGTAACLLNTEPAIARLGGTVKVAKHFTTVPASHLQTKLQEYAVSVAETIDGKMQLGVSVYGKKIRAYDVQKLGLSIKKHLRSKEVSVRLVPNKEQELNTAQVIHNKLTAENGCEIVVVYCGQEIHIGQTVAVQDIDAYTKRDREKPVRDSFVGMLPPKLAQLMLNLAQTKPESHVLDPFCGTGTVLMEALVIGSQIYGSDLSQDMVDASRANIAWFYDELGSNDTPVIDDIIQLGDAQTHSWQNIDTVVCETYLGPPLRHNPSSDELQTIQKDVLTLHVNFLKNLAPQIKSGDSICLAVPMWRINGKVFPLNLVDYLEELGYNRVSFKHVNRELQYYRPQAHVGRQLLVLKRK